VSKPERLPCVLSLSILATCIPPKQAGADSRELGDYLRIVIPVYSLGYAMHEEGYEGAEQLGYSVLSAQLTSELSKKATQEKRPDYKAGNKKDSFPSGHATGAFSGAMFIHKRYGFKQSIIPYLLAGITGYSRVEARRHHVHDILGAAAISAFYTWILVDGQSKISLSADPDSIKIDYKTNF
jgi:hypothetical protein